MYDRQDRSTTARTFIAAAGNTYWPCLHVLSRAGYGITNDPTVAASKDGVLLGGGFPDEVLGHAVLLQAAVKESTPLDWNLGIAELLLDYGFTLEYIARWKEAMERKAIERANPWLGWKPRIIDLECHESAVRFLTSEGFAVSVESDQPETAGEADFRFAFFSADNTKLSLASASPLALVGIYEMWKQLGNEWRTIDYSQTEELLDSEGGDPSFEIERAKWQRQEG